MLDASFLRKMHLKINRVHVHRTDNYTVHIAVGNRSQVTVASRVDTNSFCDE